MSWAGGLSPPRQKIPGAQSGPPPPPFVGVKNIVSDITSGISDIRAHIVCPQKTQELPKKHHEAGQPQQLPTVALSQIDCRHT